MRSLATLLFALAATAMTAVPAQELPIRVGRVAHIDGPVSLYQDPEEGWERAYVNSPITSENSVWTDDDARAELRISGMALRLDQLTQLDIARLDESELDAFVARGTLALRVRHFENNERLVFSTPNARIRVRSNGRYRIDVDPDRLQTRITVFAGEVRVGTDDGRMRVAAGRSVLVFGSDPPEFVDERAASNAFDRWTLARDGRWREGRAATYVSTYMTGYEDLDAYGSWATEPDYGALWYPRGVAASWAPYRHGRWDYVRPWGWTWIDDSPWGYAPFHYGRWVYVRNRWAWHPGERVARPAWAPALVAWIGGSNFNIGVSSGGPAVGWYPLSPWDRYDPWYQASTTYVNRINLGVRRDEPTRADRRQWREWTRERGTTVVDRGALIERRPIAAAALPVTLEAIRQARAAPRPEAVLPSRADVQQRRRAQPQPAAPAPTAPTVAQPGRQPAQPGQPARESPGRSAIARPDFGRRATVATPRAATAPPPAAAAPATAPPGRGPAAAQAQERAQRETRQQAERAAREAQQQQQRTSREAQQAQERPQREAQQQAERAAKEAQQAQERAGREGQQRTQQQQAQERAQREAQQQAERAAKEAQQAQQRAQREAQQQQQAQEKAQREAQQQAERAAKEAQRAQQQQQQQQQAQEKAQREAQQQAERAAKEAQRAQQQQQQQQQAQEKAQREAQQQAERAATEAQRAQQQQQQQRQAQEKAQREAQQAERAAKEAQRAQQQQQQAQERAQREAQQQAERAAKEAQQAQEKAQREAQQAQERAAKSAQPKGRDKDKDEDEEKEKGKGRNR